MSFLNLFPRFLVWKNGIAESFSHVKPKAYRARLLHVTGYKKHVQVYEVRIAHKSLNNSDAFVLDAGLSQVQRSSQPGGGSESGADRLVPNMLTYFKSLWQHWTHCYAASCLGWAICSCSFSKLFRSL